MEPRQGQMRIVTAWLAVICWCCVGSMVFGEISVDKDAGAWGTGWNNINTNILYPEGPFTMTWNESLSGEDALLVVFFERERANHSTVPDPNVLYTPDGGAPILLTRGEDATRTQVEGTNLVYAAIYYAVLGDRDETGTVTVNGHEAGSYAGASVVFYGVDQATPIAAEANDGTNDDLTSWSSTITTGTGTMVADVIGDNITHGVGTSGPASVWTPDSGQTEQWDLVSTGSGIAMAAGTRAGSGDINSQWSVAAAWGRAAHCLIAINPACRLVSDYDLDGNCYINLGDFALLSAGWGTTYDLTDLAGLCSDWLRCGNPNDPSCGL